VLRGQSLRWGCWYHPPERTEDTSRDTACRLQRDHLEIVTCLTVGKFCSVAKVVRHAEGETCSLTKPRPRRPGAF
jgi:hypothetical protein